MLFKFPKKKIVLDAFTDDELILKTAPIDLATKHMPDWWKNMPTKEMSDFYPKKNMKSCVGLIDFFRYSVALPMWSDLMIKMENDSYHWQFAHPEAQARVHDLKVQAPGFMPNYRHLKLQPPWQLKTKDNINWVWNSSVYNLNEIGNDVTVLPGIMNFKNNNSTNTNLMISPKENTIFIKQGTPIVLMTPMSERPVKVVRHLISTAEYQRMLGMHNSITFNQVNKSIVSLTKKFSGCPFKNHLKD